MKITKRQLKRIIREEKRKILSEALSFGEYGEETFGRLPQQFQDIAQRFEWSMESIDGEITSDAGDGNFTLVLSKGEYVLQCEYSYGYQARGPLGEYWNCQLTGPGVDMVFPYGSEEGLLDDIRSILSAFERATSFNKRKFKNALRA